MYKNKLQELCQKKSWDLPDYETKREGPPHNSRFLTTVTVNSVPFTPPTESRTVKASQNDAAMLAFNHFSQQQQQQQQNPISPPFLPNFSSFPQPAISASSSSRSEGLLVHSPDVNKTLPTNSVLQPNSEPACETSQISSPVADVADVMKSQDLKNMNMIHLYKAQLQIYAQKRNLKLPEYSPEWEGPPHAMRFKCKVTIDGQTFESPKFYSTLKEAEHAAAENALTSLSPSGIKEDEIVVYKNLLQELVQKEGLQLPVYSTNQSGEAHKPIFSSQVEIVGEIFIGQESKSKKQAEMSAAKVAYTTLKERKALGGQAPDCAKENVTTGEQQHSNGESSVSTGLAIENPADKDKVEKNLSPENTNGCSGVSIGSKSKAIPSVSDSNNFDFETSIVSSNAVSSPSRPKKLIVYSTKTNVEIEKGGNVLPISDDKWIAYSYSH
ncbi:double-stranded RNA-binding protein 1-like isoform X1 [Trifolium pratense]|uniref:double-stranded RNA-binding protein 1-like isoform X1 n=1 Tax=Trifolium pratense TaxID=57577 RepID=UPI001E698066|nr:double-stranded RNA-binding protein 1-like isoform X1 [Trifolium pratense]